MRPDRPDISVTSAARLHVQPRRLSRTSTWLWKLTNQAKALRQSAPNTVEQAAGDTAGNYHLGVVFHIKVIKRWGAHLLLQLHRIKSPTSNNNWNLMNCFELVENKTLCTSESFRKCCVLKAPSGSCPRLTRVLLNISSIGSQSTWLQSGKHCLWRPCGWW